MAPAVGALAGDEPVFASGARLCLESVAIPTGEADDPRRARLEDALVEYLEASSFAVRRPSEVAPRLEALVEARPPYIDTATGERLPEVWDAFLDGVAADLRDELGCDFRVEARIVQVAAPFRNGSARVDGRTMQVSSPGRVVRNVFAGVNEWGWVPALSLWVEVTDLRGELVAFRSAGVEPLVSLAVLVDQDLKPEDAWLSNPKDVGLALVLALGLDAELLLERGVPGGRRR
ncbi:MAG: hypothetical protein KC560_10120 [Myxococcales bacterium]|nr:hypothetical protein [Myxococcales bacterium]